MANISIGSRPELSGRTPVRHVGIVVFDGTHLADVACASEVFHRCNAIATAQSSSLPRYVTSILSCRGGIITSSGSISVLTQALGQQTQIFDTLLVASGSYNVIRFQERILRDFLQRNKTQVRRLGGICTGVFALAEAGLLNERRATTHPALQSKLVSEFPAVKLECRDAITEDQGVFTARDAGSARQLALRWIEADFGSAMAIKVAQNLDANSLELPVNAPQAMPVVSKKQGPSKMREASHWLLKHLADDINLSAAAESVCMSERNFLRQFKREFAQTPREFLLRARLDMARHELKVTDLPIDKIGRRCGLGNGEHVAKLFRKYMAVTPVEYRQREQVRLEQ